MDNNAEEQFHHNVILTAKSHQNSDNGTKEYDNDGTREQFAIASIILQLSQQCSQPQAKRRRGKCGDAESPAAQREGECLQIQDFPSIAPMQHQICLEFSASPPTKARPALHPQPMVAELISLQVQPESISSSAAEHGVLRSCLGASPTCGRSLLDSSSTESNTEDINRELAASSWASMDEMVSEGAGNYCASVSSEDDKGAKCELRRTYRCSKCGAEKKGHVCSAKVNEPASPSPIVGVRIHSIPHTLSFSAPMPDALLFVEFFFEWF